MLGPLRMVKLVRVMNQRNGLRDLYNCYGLSSRPLYFTEFHLNTWIYLNVYFKPSNCVWSTSDRVMPCHHFLHQLKMRPEEGQPPPVAIQTFSYFFISKLPQYLTYIRLKLVECRKLPQYPPEYRGKKYAARYNSHFPNSKSHGKIPQICNFKHWDFTTINKYKLSIHRIWSVNV